MEYYSAIKKNETLSFVATWMDSEIIIQVKLDRKRQIACDITYTWNLKRYTRICLQNTNILTNIKNKLLVIREKEGEG